MSVSFPRAAQVPLHCTLLGWAVAPVVPPGFHTPLMKLSRVCTDTVRERDQLLHPRGHPLLPAPGSDLDLPRKMIDEGKGRGAPGTYLAFPHPQMGPQAPLVLQEWLPALCGRS